MRVSMHYKHLKGHTSDATSRAYSLLPQVLVVLRSKITCYIDIHKRAASTELPRRLAAHVTLNHDHKAFSNSQPIFTF
jgi:hypothetical protein